MLKGKVGGQGHDDPLEVARLPNRLVAGVNNAYSHVIDLLVLLQLFNISGQMPTTPITPI